VSATVALSFSATSTESVGYSATPSWERQWLDLRTAFDVVAGYYSGVPLDNRDAARAVHDGCLAAWALAEHVPDAPDGISYRDSDSALKDASDLINTWKHAGRKAKYTRGRIAYDHGHIDGTRSIELEFVDPGQGSRSRDALELLGSSLGSWHAYLSAVGFKVDWPPTSP
jgi:hypothetical protein